MADFPQDEIPTKVEGSRPPPPPETQPPEPSYLGAPLSAYQRAASALLAYAVGGTKPLDVHGFGSARQQSDPIYKLVVEGRVGPAYPHYSSCGDLAHWLYFRLGVRLPWVNRKEFAPPAGHGWRMGLNLNLLAPKPIGPNATAKPGRGAAIPQFMPGDTIQIANQFGGHEICVMGPLDEHGAILTGEYGQPYGACKSHALAVHSSILFCGSNQVASYLLLGDVLAAAAAANALAPVDVSVLEPALASVFKK